MISEKRQGHPSRLTVCPLSTAHKSVKGKEYESWQPGRWEEPSASGSEGGASSRAVGVPAAWSAARAHTPRGRGLSPGPAACAALSVRLLAETRGLPDTRKEWDQLWYHIHTSLIITCQVTEDQADISNPLKLSCEGWYQSVAASQLTDSPKMEKKTAS